MGLGRILRPAEITSEGKTPEVPNHALLNKLLHESAERKTAASQRGTGCRTMVEPCFSHGERWAIWGCNAVGLKRIQG